MPEPVFSVVLPAYNAASFITRTLECLNSQKFRDFEAIIVNDGSTDNTQAVISEYISAHPNLRLRLINQKNAGIAGARNKGILEAKGSYVAFLDHDDFWYPDKLSQCHEIFSSLPETTVVCHNEALRDASGRIVRYLKYGPYVDGMFRRLLYQGSCLSTSATVIRRDVFASLGLFRENPEFSTVEDYDLWLRLSRKHKIYFISETLGEYVINNKNASLNFEKHYNNQLYVLKTNFREEEQKRISDYFFMLARIIRVYLILTKESLRQKKIGKSIKYLTLTLKQPFLDVRK